MLLLAGPELLHSCLSASLCKCITLTFLLWDKPPKTHSWPWCCESMS